MRVITGRPPMWDEIDAKFHVAGRRVIFAWGNVIYNPMNIVVPASLFAHEAVHGRRQGKDIEGWWRRYIDDPDFRLAEEIPAHQAEYDKAISLARNRNERRAAEKGIAARLASPLYGKLIQGHEARKLLTQKPEHGGR